MNKRYLNRMTELFCLQQMGELTCNEVADKLNREFGMNKGESAYRKFFRAFMLGREYEREGGGADVATRILAISDLHVPFVDWTAAGLEEWDGKVDVLVVNGDVMDCQALSKFPKQYRGSVVQEMDLARSALIGIIGTVKPKKVLINYGNHDLRFQNYLARMVDSDVKDLLPPTALELICNKGFDYYDKQNGVQHHYEPLRDTIKTAEVIYTRDWKCKVGQTWFAHPQAYSQGTLKTVLKARDYFFLTDKEPFDAVVMAHTHRIGYTASGRVHLYEQGSLCQTEKMNYLDGKLATPQQNGICYIAQDEKGCIIPTLSKVINLS